MVQRPYEESGVKFSVLPWVFCSLSIDMPFGIVACEVWTNGMIDHGSTTKHIYLYMYINTYCRMHTREQEMHKENGKNKRCWRNDGDRENILKCEPYIQSIITCIQLFYIDLLTYSHTLCLSFSLTLCHCLWSCRSLSPTSSIHSIRLSFGI